MVTISNLAETATLVGDPARANMLAALMDGRALGAGELAQVAGIMPQTASGHLARLVEGNMLAMVRQGRHRYFRLASPAVARMLEAIMAASSGQRPLPVRVGPRDAALRRARTCYDHLAGEIAVAIADTMAARGDLDLSADGAAMTAQGTDFLRRLGIALDPARRGPVFCRPCLDWSERRDHIAGAVGAAMYRMYVDRAWLRPVAGTRAATVTPMGRAEFEQWFDIRL